MNDDDREYYDRKVKRADETANLLFKATFWMIVFAAGYAIAIWIQRLTT